MIIGGKMVGDEAVAASGSWGPIIVAVAGMVIAVILCGAAAALISRRQRSRRDAALRVPPTGVTSPTAPTTPTTVAIPSAPTDSPLLLVAAPLPLFSPTPAPTQTPVPTAAEAMFDSVEPLPPPPPPVFSASINLESDVRIVRATAATERAIASLRAVHDERPDPTPRALAVAIEAAASGWLENRRITPDEVVRLLDPDRTGADPMTLDIADGLLDLLGGHDANVWDLALAFAERLGHPHVARTSDHYGNEAVAGTLVEQVAAVAALDQSDFVGRLGGIVGRGLLASWPARTGRLDQLPLIVSPSLAAAADGLADTSVDPSDLIVGLLAVMEDAAMRMMRSEQGVATLRRRYLDEVGRPASPSRSKFADKSSPTTRWFADGPATIDAVDRRLVDLIVGSPVVTTALVATELEVDSDRASVALDGLAERGWLERLDDAATGSTRWLAREVVDHATRPFAPEYSPLDPVTIDLTVSCRTVDLVVEPSR